MTESLKNKIIQALSTNDGLKAKDLAHSFNVNKKEINSILYSLKGKELFVDAKYQWHINNPNIRPPQKTDDTHVDKNLYNLCRYYLSCINLEDNNKISAFLTSLYTTDYKTVQNIDPHSFGEQANELIRKANTDRNIISYLGYPVQIYTITGRNGRYKKIAPIFIHEIETDSSGINLSCIPNINMEVISNFSSRDIDEQINNLIQIERDLCMDDPDAELSLDDLVFALEDIRPQWPWKEKPDPESLSFTNGIPANCEDGIYNTAIVINSQRSPYTAGLVEELSMLMKLDTNSFKETALYQWIYGIPAVNSERTKQSEILSVLPMNTEQYEAVSHSLQDSLTVITGPPGTGKSQVVTNILINLIKRNKNVLFTSKNNKAVDVVETRLNNISGHPVMLRVGNANQYAVRFSHFIRQFLDFQTVTQEDKDNFEHLNNSYSKVINEYDKYLEEKHKVIALRNKVDKLENVIYDRREKYGQWINKVDIYNIEQLKKTFSDCQISYNAAQKDKQPFLTRLFWPFCKSNRYKIAEESIEKLNIELNKYSINPLPSFNDTDDTNLDSVSNDINEFVTFIEDSNKYITSLNNLSETTPSEIYDLELWRCQERLSQLAEQLWNSWLSIQGLNINSETRKKMNEYIQAINLITGVPDLNQYPNIRKNFNSLQSTISKTLKCWAVTALSAKNRIPFTPGCFECVVIDEASQCDIASMLPLLYRAKRAVIIGDDKQLTHISTLTKRQDIDLLNKYNIHTNWSYSQCSLFGKAIEICNDNLVMLKDHHRSHNDIIGFSNKEFYGGRLRIATNYQHLKYPQGDNPGLRWIDVVGEAKRPSGGSLKNEEEAKRVILEIKNLLSKGYTGSIGVVTPFKAQAEYIKSLIEQDEYLLNHDILADTVHKFQGDERDIMLFSTVISQGTTDGAFSFLRNNGNLFNVAITRARAVLIVVGNMDYCQHCNVEYLRHFTDYYLSQTKKIEQETDCCATFESEWEEILFNALSKEGIEPKIQYKIDKYRLDMALILPNGKKLDIEVDGEHYHKAWNGELCYRDQIRNQRMYELGWDVKRFWVYQIRDNIQYCIDEIKKWIKENQE